MTQERFLKLLDNPDLLASISYEELKTLALAYPYAHNLRYLLAIKARQDNHPDFTRNLAAAAAYSLDRTRLFTLIAPHRLAPQPVLSELEGLVLELKPIETVQRELQARAPIPRVVESALQNSAAAAQITPGPSEAPATPVDQAELTIDLNGMTEQKMEASLPKENGASPTPEDNLPMSEINSAPVSAIVIRPSFGVWASQFNPPVLEIEKPAVSENLPERPRVKLPAPTPEMTPPPESGASGSDTPAIKAQMLAEKSVTENQDILSETLARLYARQGYREKAIRMYQRLSLAFPDKSAYFAAEIEKLKK